MTTDQQETTTMKYKATFTVVAPVAKTVSYRFAELPEDREIEAICARLGQVARVMVEAI